MENATPESAKDKGGRPRNPVDMQKLASMPEVQALIAAAVDKAAADILAQLNEKRVEAGVSVTPAPGDDAWANRLALALAQVANPGRTPIDPAVIAQREAARTRMFDLIVDARANDKVPEYELRNKVFFEEQLIEPMYTGTDRVLRHQVIGWRDVPNEAMRPANETAREIFSAFLESIGTQLSDVQPEAKSGSLLVMTGGQLRTVPQVGGAPRRQGSGDLTLRGRNQPGEVVETNVLGTRAAPARQIA